MNYIIVSGILVIITLIIIFIASSKYGKIDFSEYDDMVISSKILFIGKFIVDDLTGKSVYKLEKNNVEKVRENYEKLYGGKVAKECAEIHYYSKYSLVILGLFAFSMFAMLSSVMTYREANAEKDVLEEVIDRPDYQTDAIVKDYVATLEYDGEVLERRVAVSVPAEQPTLEQQRENMDLALKRIEQYALKDNASFDKITGNLKLYEEDVLYDASISWETDSPEFVSHNGVVRLDLLEEDETPAVLTATVIVGELTEIKEIPITIIKPNPLSLSSLVAKDLNVALKDEGSANKSEYVLPSSFSSMNEEVKITWSVYEEEVSYRTSGVMLFFGIVLSILFFKVVDDRLNEKLKDKQNKMTIQFPVFADKFILLYSCGISPVEAIKIYLQSFEGNIGKDDYLNNELIFMLEQIEFGGEAIDDALLQFGKRSRVPDILKFTTLVSQDIRKGDKNMAESINKLVIEAWEERKKLVLELGSKASTKLLLPMMLMLVLVIILVMTPAINTFNSF